jgi:hypothetical protein
VKLNDCYSSTENFQTDVEMKQEADVNSIVPEYAEFDQSQVNVGCVGTISSTSTKGMIVIAPQKTSRLMWK